MKNNTQSKQQTNTLPILIVLLVLSVPIFLVLARRNRVQVLNTTVQAQPTQTPLALRIISGSFDQSQFKTEAEWKKILTPPQYLILRQQGTEIPFTGTLLHETRKGTYFSVGCNVALFRSEQKYDSGTGWPSFWAPINQSGVVLREDDSIPNEPRVEVLDVCGNHLGHVFDDGPAPTGKRYCMNSIALRFVPDAKQ